MDVRQQLNAYSRRFADRLFAAHPEWETRARLEPWPNADPGCFVVAVPSPGRPERELCVGTDGGEITVGFGEEWHDHHGHWAGASEEESFAEALEQIEGILAERLAVAVGFRAGRGAVSTLIAVGSEPEFLSDDIDRVTLYSWRGTHDSSVPA